MLYWKPPSSVLSQYRPLLSYIVNITIGTNEPVVYTTTDTSLKLPASLTICDPITATVTVTSGDYSSSAVSAEIVNSECEFIHM